MPGVKHQRRDATNPLVYFDVTIGAGSGATDLGRVVFELYNDVAPKVQLHQLGPNAGSPEHGDDHYDSDERVLSVYDCSCVVDCRELQAAMYWRGWRGRKYQVTATFQGVPFP